MYAHVVPLRRLPRKIDTLDYRISRNMHVEAGSLVQITFRTRKIFGVVLALSKTTSIPEKSLQDIGAVFGEEPLLSLPQLQLAQEIAQMYGTALSTVMAGMCPPLQPRKLAKINLTPYGALPKKISENRYLWYRTREEKREWFLKNAIPSDGQILIIVPEKWHMSEWQEILPSGLKEHAVEITSDLSPKELFEKYFEIRNGTARVVIGTKIALFAPFKKLAHIYFDFEHNPHHKNWDQAPRYHARDVAVSLAHGWHAELTVMSHTPSVESAVRLAGHPLMRATRIETKHPVHVVDTKQEYQKKNFSLMSDTADELLAHARERRKDILIMVHRRGAHTTVTCRDCGRTMHCPNCGLAMIYYESPAGMLRCNPCRHQEQLRPTCAFCHGPHIAFRGAGTQHVEEKMRTLFSGTPYEIIRADSDTEIPNMPIDKPVLLVGTSRALSFIRFGRLGLIVFPDIDGFLSIPEYRASAEFIGLVRDITYFAPEGTSLVLQTRDPLRPLVQALATESLGGWYREELATRRQLHYPPFWSILKLTYFGASQSDAEKTGELAYHKLAALTAGNKNAILTHPYPTHPPQKLGRFGTVLLLRMPGSEARMEFSKLLAALNLAPEWKIDVDPLQLLS